MSLEKAWTILLVAIFCIVVILLATEFSRPDWSPQKTEVTLRPDLLFPSGRIIMLDNFNSPTLKWQTKGSTGSTETISTESAFEGDSSLKLLTGTGSPFSGRVARSVGLPASKKIGAQFTWNRRDALAGTIEVHFEYDNGTTRYLPRIRYSDVNKIWQYFDTNGNWQDISGSDQELGGGQFIYHFFKVIFDISAGTFVRLYSDDLSLDLTGLSLWTGSTAVSPSLEVEIGAYAVSTAQKRVYIDNVAITEED